MFRFKRITITGHKGILGSQLFSLLEGSAEIQGLDLPECNITDRIGIQTELRSFKPDLVFHCSAYTNVDKAESEVETAFQVNALATRWLAQICAELQTVMVYFSTDYVFCATPGVEPRREYHQPQPKGIYAQSKYAGELEIRSFHPRHYIIRTSWLYGDNGRNFVATILRLAQEKPFLSVVKDQIGSPTYALDLAKEVLRLVETDLYGLYHISGNGSCSWFDFAQAILKAVGSDKKVYPITTFELNAPAPRPSYSYLDNFALRNTIGDQMPFWKVSLESYLKRKGLMK
jgi:dTDP-4-dehydrorhamnose reductase